MPSLDERANRERLRRRAHLIRLRTSAINRTFGLLTQWGLRLSLKRLRAPDAMGLLEQRGVPEVWRRSIAEALAVIDLLDERITPIDQELGPLARADDRKYRRSGRSRPAGYKKMLAECERLSRDW